MGKKHKNYYFVGIGGVGMSPLAEFLFESGNAVAGTDVSSSATVSRLMAKGIQIQNEHKKEHIKNFDCLVISSAINEDNLELREAKKAGIDIFHRSDILKEISATKDLIGVTGTHGKTTTTAMILSTLINLEKDPSGVVGGELLSLSQAYRRGEGALFAAELDESDGSFLKFRPKISLITNVDLDHLDYYRDMDHIKETYLSFLKNTHEEGVAIIGWDTSEAREVAELFEGEKISYGFATGSDIRCYDFTSHNGHTNVKAIVIDKKIEFSIPTIGKHNVQNALGVIAVCHYLEMPMEAALAALTNYQGVKRRSQLVFDSETVTIFDDYAHNPGKVNSCLQGIKAAWPSRRVVALFQPHRYTRTKDLFEGFSKAFSYCDETCVFPVYSAGEKPIDGVDASHLSEAIQEHSCENTRDYKSFEEYLTGLVVKEPSIFVTIGAGDIWKLSESIKGKFK